MSASSQSVVSLLECSLCMTTFTDPRMLPNCFHTFCKVCLGDHMEQSGQRGQFQCPVCRKSLPIPADGAEGFPKSFFINSCMAVVNDSQTGAKSKTKKSSEDRHVPESNRCNNSDDGDDCTQPEEFCVDCCEYYCKACSKAHRKSKATRSHEQIALDDLTDRVLKEALIRSASPNCSQHKEEKMVLYCDTCQCTICSACSRDDNHDTHTVRECVDVDEDLKAELIKAISALQHYQNAVTEQTDSFKQPSTTESNAPCTIINGIFQKMHNMLDGKAKDMQQQLTLDVQLINNLLSCCQDLLKNGNVFIRLANVPVVRARCEELGCLQLDSTGDAPCAHVTTLVARHFNSILLEQEVDVVGPGTENEQTLQVQVKCHIKHDQAKEQTRHDQSVQTDQIPLIKEPSPPKPIKPRLRVVQYNYSARFSDMVEEAARYASDEFQCDVSRTDSRSLEPLVSGQPQVDILCYWNDSPTPQLEPYRLTEEVTDGRRLVFLYCNKRYLDTTAAKLCNQLDCNSLAVKEYES